MKLYLPLVQNDRANKSSSTPRHLTPVDKVLQFANLHSALQPKGQRFGSVHRASPCVASSEAATDPPGRYNPHLFSPASGSEVRKQEDTSLITASAALHVWTLFCLLYFERLAVWYLTVSSGADDTSPVRVVCYGPTCRLLTKDYQTKSVNAKIHILLSSPPPSRQKAAQHCHQGEFIIRGYFCKQK